MRRRRGAASLALSLGTSATLALVTSASAADVSVNSSGNVVADGTEIFPIGMIHVSWIGNRQGEDAVADLIRIAKGSFNVIQATVDARPDMVDLFDAAAAAELYVMAETPSPPDAFVNLWKNHPAIAAWYVADDFNGPYSGPANHPASEVAARSALTQSLAPNHITYASGGSYPGYRITEYAGTADMLAFQSYPIASLTSPFEDELEEVALSYDYVVAELDGTGQPFIASPQSFCWGGGRWPTVAEQRNMLFTALLYGPKGVLWYTVYDNGGFLPDKNPAAWQEVVSEAAELNSLASFLLHGARFTLATGALRVRASAWRLDGQTLVVLTNTERDVDSPVTLTLPDGVTGSAMPMFPLRAESGLTLLGSTLSGTVGSEEVHVYLVDEDLAGNVEPTAAIAASATTGAMLEALDFDGSASFDADGTVADYEWDFGDGARGAGATVAHAYETPGTYAVRLTVRDDDGGVSSAVEILTIGVTDLCPTTPRVDCAAATGAKLRVRDEVVPGRFKLTWSWKGAGGTPSVFGNPVAGDAVALCVYDENGLRLVTAALGGVAWKANASGFKARRRDGYPGGIVSARLKAGSTTALTMKARGGHLTALDSVLGDDATVQAIAEGTTFCWASVHTE